jgi:amino acid transporter
MLRAIAEGFVLFLLPFVAFAAYLVLRGQNPLRPEVWSRKALSWLTIAALILCIVGVVVVGALSPRQQGTIIPSHVDKDGQFVPGHFKR